MARADFILSRTRGPIFTEITVSHRDGNRVFDDPSADPFFAEALFGRRTAAERVGGRLARLWRGASTRADDLLVSWR